MFVKVSYQTTSYVLNYINENNDNFYVTAVSNNKIESFPSNTVTYKIFNAKGNYTTYYNDGFNGIVFNYQSGSQSLTLFYPLLVTLIVVGGGGWWYKWLIRF